MRIFAACLAIALAPLMTACSGGGGGGGGSSTGSSDNSSGSSGNPPPTQNLASISTPPQPWTFPATTLTAQDSSGNTYSLSISNKVPSGSVTYDGQTAYTAVLGVGVSENGAVLSTQDATLFYAINPYTPLGFAGSVDGVAYNAAITGFTPFPSTLKVGSSGPVLSATYTDPSGTTIGSLSETYTVTADSATALFVNIDASGTVNGSAFGETISYELSDTGSTTPTLSSVQLNVNGTALTFQ